MDSASSSTRPRGATDRAEERWERAGAPSAGEGELPPALDRLDVRLREWDAQLRAAEEVTSPVEKRTRPTLCGSGRPVTEVQRLCAGREPLLQQTERGIKRWPHLGSPLPAKWNTSRSSFPGVGTRMSRFAVIIPAAGRLAAAPAAWRRSHLCPSTGARRVQRAAEPPWKRDEDVEQGLSGDRAGGLRRLPPVVPHRYSPSRTPRSWTVVRSGSNPWRPARPRAGRCARWSRRLRRRRARS